MGFQELCLTLDDAYNTYDNISTKIGIYAEASFNEFQTNLKEAELKVVTESGTTEDLIYLESEAKEGFLVRSKHIIDKIIEEFKEFCRKIAEAVKNFFSSNDKELKDLQTKINNNPKAKNKKVKIIDMKGVEKTTQKYRDENKKLMAKAKVGKANKEDFTKLKDKFDKELAAKVAVTVTVTAVAAIGLIIALKNVNKPETIKPEPITADMPVEMVESVVEGTKIDAAIASEERKLKFKFIPDTFNRIKQAITGIGEIEPMSKEEFKAARKQFKESMEDEDMNNLLDEFLKESEDLDSEVEVTAEEYLEAMEEVLFEDDEDTFEESDDDDNEVTAEEYLEAMEEVLFEDDEDAFEESDDDVVTVGDYLAALEAEIGL